MLLELVKDAWKALTSNTDTGREPEDRPVAFRTTSPKPSESLPMKSYLKVKIKSLAEEATIIRKEERRVKRSLSWWTAQAPATPEDGPPPPSNYQETVDNYRSEYFGLHNHRTYEVRNESRASQLAYAYIQGYPYTKVEDPTKTRKPFPAYRVADLALKYGKVPVPTDTPYNKRREVAAKILQAWSEGKTTFSVDGTNGQVLRPTQ